MVVLSKVSPIIHLPAEWEKFIDGLRGRKRRIMVVGPPDSGKSSFCRAIYERVDSAAIIDMDPGQQNIVIPGAVGAEFKSRFRTQRFTFFIGRTSPRGIGGLISLSLRSLLLRVEKFSPKIILLDTSGYVDGEEALILKLTKAFIFQPTDIVFLEDGSSRTFKMKTILGIYFRTHSLPKSVFACQIPSEGRAEIRRKRVSEYFSGGQVFRIRKDESRIIYMGYNEGEGFKDLIGFFKNGITSAIGLIRSEGPEEFEIISSDFPRRWDFAIKSSIKF